MTACLQHPEFPQPEAPDTALWRYMDASKFEWLVSNGRLLMPTAGRLGDKWEGTIPQGHSNWWDHTIAKASTEDQRATLEHNRTFIGKMAQAFRSHYYVSCWHQNEHENHAMWSCYTRTPDAVAIKTRYNMLAEVLPAYAFLGNVRYIDYSLVRQPSMNMFEVIMHKDIFFAFEQETRVVVLPPATNPDHIVHFRDNYFTSEKDETFRCFAPTVDLSRLITDIVLHPEANVRFAEHIATLCKTNGLPAPAKSRRLLPLGN